jgi:acyl-CoA synthetase (NDP forming)
MDQIRRFRESFPPRSIAVVGVSKRSSTNAPGYNGLKRLQILRESGFKGPVYPIHPKLSEIDGTPVYPNVGALPAAPDLVVVAVQAAVVPQVLEDCVSAGVTTVQVCTSGFGETGDAEGEALEERIRGIASRGDLCVIGPNCMGFHVPSAGMRMFEHTSLEEGPVAFVSQSGGHAYTFLKHGEDFGLGFSKVVSYGNALTLDAPDYLEYLAGDPETRIICMYIEGVRDGRRLIEQVRSTNPSKPVIIWKGGLTQSGARAAASHTGSLAGERQIWDAFFRQTGAIQVGSIEEMVESALTLLSLRRSPSRRVAVLSSGGGANVATGDICAEEGLEVPALTGPMKSSLLEFVSTINQGVTNPMDVPGVLADLPVLRRTVEVLTGDDLLDTVILHLSAPFFSEPLAGSVEEFEETVLELNRSIPTSKAVVVALDESYRFDDTDLYARRLRKTGIVTFTSLRKACRALRRFARYNGFLEEVALAKTSST